MLLGILKLLFALLITAALIATAAIAFNRPPLLASPGPLPRIAAYLTQNSAETERFSAYPERTPPTYRESPETILDAAVSHARSRGWEMLDLDPERYRMHAEATTLLFGFKDNVHVRVEPMENGGSKLYIRSASRSGLADFGANTARLIDIREGIDRRL